MDVTGVAGYKRPSQALEVAEEDQLHCSNHTVRVTVELQPSPLFTGQPQVSLKLLCQMALECNYRKSYSNAYNYIRETIGEIIQIFGK